MRKYFKKFKIEKKEMVNAIISGAFLISLFVVPFSPLIHTAQAAFNKQINYQGKLTNGAGVAVANGTYNMEFKLYTASSGGSPVWTETRTGADKVQVSNGLFSIMLGEVSTLSGVDFNQTLYLGVKIESDSEMTPRKKLGAVPAAVEAEHAATATTATSSTKAANLVGGNNTTLFGSIPFQSNTDTTSFVAPNTTTTKKFFTMTGTGTNGVTPSWDEVTATDVGLGNVTNESKTTMFTSPTFTGTVAGFTMGGNLALGSNTITTSNTGLVTNLNADMLDGKHSSDFALAANYVPYTGATTNVVLGANTLSTTSGLISPKIYPASDSTTAFQINKADGNTNILNVDTTNGRVGIGTTGPTNKLSVVGVGYSSSGITNVSQLDGIRFTQSSPGNDNMVGLSWADAGGAAITMGRSGWSTNISFYTNPSTTTTSGATREAMTLYGNGSMCVGCSGGYSYTGRGKILAVGSNATTLLQLGGNTTSGMQFYQNINNTDYSIVTGATYEGAGVGQTWYGRTANVSSLRFENGNTRFYGDTGHSGYFDNFTERMVITNTGSVGIGTTSPTAVLHLKAGTATANTAPLKFTSGTNLGTPEAGAMEYDGTNLYFTPAAERKTVAFTSDLTTGYVPYTGANANVVLGANTLSTTSGLITPKIYPSADSKTAFQINKADGTTNVLNVDTTNGRVGIGTTNPSGNLSFSNVSGTTYINSGGKTGLTTNYEMLRLSAHGWGGYQANSTQDEASISFYTSPTNADQGEIVFKTNNSGLGANLSTEKVRIKSSGDISSVGNLNLNGATQTIKLGLGGTSAQRVSGLDYAVSSPNIYTDIYGAGIGGGWNGGIRLFTANNATSGNVTPQERVRIDSTGNVGIGTTSPGTTLEVAGAIRSGLFATSQVNSGDAWFGRPSNTPLGTFAIQLGGTSDIGTEFKIIDRAWTKVIADISGEAPGSSFMINNLGKVGIGTSNPTARLQINQTEASQPALGTAGGNFAILNGSSGVYGLYMGVSGSGSTWMQSQRNDSAIAYNILLQANGGNVGIGTTTPLSKLSINGGLHVGGDSDAGDNNILADGTIQASSYITTNAAFVVDNGSNQWEMGNGTDYSYFYNYISGKDVLKLFNNGNATFNDGVTANTFTSNIATGTAPFSVTSTTVVSNLNADMLDGLHSSDFLNSSVLADYVPYTGATKNVDLGTHNLTVDTNSLFVDSVNHRVGIGTTTPSSKLEVAGDVTLGDANYLQWGVGSTWIKGNSGTGIISMEGNVGIGTTSPQKKLDIRSSSNDLTSGIMISASDYETNGGYLILNKNSGSGAYASIQSGDAGAYSSLILNQNGGNVGIGTTNPQAKLHIGSSLNTLPSNTSISVNGESYIRFTGGEDGNSDYGSYLYGTQYSGVRVLNLGTRNGSVDELAMTLRQGNVGIGTTAPQTKLDITAATNNGYDGFQVYALNRTQHLSLGWNSLATTDIFNIYTNNQTTTPSMTILNTGNVGIGTTPGYKLQVNGTAHIGVGAVNAGDVTGTLQIGGGGTYYMTQIKAINTASTPGILKTRMGFFTLSGTGETAADATEKMSILADSGNVGIGTTAPFSRLTVGGTTLQDSILGFEALTSQSDSRRWRIANDRIVYGDFSIEQSTTNSSTTFASRLYIKNDGNIGIGTTNPGAKLDINAVNGGILLSDGTDMGYLKSNVNLELWADANNDNSSTYQNIIFKTAGNTERMRIAGGGNVGIGTTSPGTKLDVQGGYISTTDTGGNTAFLQGAAGVAYFGAIGANRASFGNSENYETLTVDGGLVGIGTTTPKSRLHLYNGQMHLNNLSDGDASINSNTYAMQIGPLSNRLGTAGTYYGGIAFNHLLNYGGGATTYNNSPQIWIGPLLYDTPGSERDSLVFATKEGTGTTGTGTDIPTPRMTITPFGNVGIGTTNPISGTKLDVRGVINIPSGNGIWFGDANTEQIYEDGANNIGIRTGGTDRLTVLSTGNVGIGTTSPTYGKLQVAGNIVVNRPSNKVDSNGGMSEISSYIINNDFASSYSGYVRVYYPSYNNLLFGADYDGNVGGVQPNIQFGRYGSPYLTVVNNGSNAGNVGIGTTDPSGRLAVHGSSVRITVQDTQGTGYAMTNYRAGGGNVSDAYFGVDAGSSALITGGGGLAYAAVISRQGNYPIQFGTNNVARMTITGDGNIGIGTTSPNSRLDVKKAITTDESLAMFVNTANDYRSYIYIGSAPGTDWKLGKDLTNAGNSRFFISDHNNIEKFNILTNGNVGIGTTSPETHLQVGNYSTSEALTLGMSNDTEGRINFYDGNNTEGAAIRVVGSSGGAKMHFANRWNTDSDKVTFDLINGRVGIGTTAPDVALTTYGAMGTIQPNSRHYYDVASYNYEPGITGTMIFSSPKITSDTMLQVHIKGYDYSGSNSWEVVVSGYSYTGYWVNAGVQFVSGTPPFKSVRLANDGTHDLIMLGDTSTSWSYPNVVITDLITYYRNYDNYGKGWTSTVTTSEPTLYLATTLTPKTYVDTSGNFGIGNTSPSKKLDVSGDIRLTGSVYSSINPLNFLTDGSGALQVRTGGLTAWDSYSYTAPAGGAIFQNNVGIGTSDPGTTKLNVKTAGHNRFFNFESSSNGTGYVYGNMTNSGGSLIMGVDENTGQNLFTGSSPYATTFGSVGATPVQFGTDQIIRMTILPTSGNVGIGTATPDYKLDVAGSIHLRSLNATLEMGNGNSASSYGSLGFNDSVNDVELKQKYPSGNIRFFTNTSSERMVISQAGYIGIGTSSPNTKLQINNECAINDVNAPGQGLCGLHFSGQTTGDYANGITWNGGYSSQATAQAGIYVQGSGNYGTKMYFATTNDYGAGSKTRMMIDNAGNVGIGTTSPSYKLTVNSLGNSGSTAAAIYGQYYGPVVSSGQGSSSYYAFNITNNASGPGTGNSIFYARADGNIGIGTTAPESLLHVGSGTGAFTAYGVYPALFVKRGNEHTVPIVQFAASGSGGCGGCINETLRVDATYSGGSSQTNIGLRVNASGASYNYAALFESGNVGIGTNSPVVKLDVNGGINLAAGNNLTWGGAYNPGIPTIDATTSAGFRFYPSGSTSGSNIINFAASGSVGIGTTDPGIWKLYVEGAIYGSNVTASYINSSSDVVASGTVSGYTGDFGGAITAQSDITSVSGSLWASGTQYYSDRTLKENIQGISDIDKFKNVSFYQFNYKAIPGKLRYGVIAQEIQEYAPELVSISKDGKLAVNYNDLFVGKFAYNDKLMQEQQRKIENIQSELFKYTSIDTNSMKNITTLEDKEYTLQTFGDDIKNSSISNKLMSLSVVKYNTTNETDTDPKHITLITDELIQLFPESIITDPQTGRETISYTSLIPYTVKAIQEMNLQFQDINNMEKENSIRTALTSWLGNATNKITRIFTGEICLTDEDGQTECINRSELKDLKSLINTNGTASVVNTPSDTTTTTDTTTSTTDTTPTTPTDTTDTTVPSTSTETTTTDTTTPTPTETPTPAPADVTTTE